jgi:hypothetical protein
MPRPPDTYTHGQFESIDPDNVHGKVETARCIHCRVWQGHTRALNRKKAHLHDCESYREWRAAGNGQDMAPHNPYNKRDSSQNDEYEYV